MNVIMFLVGIYALAIVMSIFRCYFLYKEYCVENKYAHLRIKEMENVEAEAEADSKDSELVAEEQVK